MLLKNEKYCLKQTEKILKKFLIFKFKENLLFEACLQ